MGPATFNRTAAAMTPRRWLKKNKREVVSIGTSRLLMLQPNTHAKWLNGRIGILSVSIFIRPALVFSDGDRRDACAAKKRRCPAVRNAFPCVRLARFAT